MPPVYAAAVITDPEAVANRVIGAAIEVHRTLGPGFLESAYEAALAIELDHLGIRHEKQKLVVLSYCGRAIGEHRLDLLVEACLVVELKSVAKLDDVFFAIVRSYMKAANVNLGLILNFASMPLTIKRVGREDKSRIGALPPPEKKFLSF
jgi:GxxExxY protein